MKITSYSVWSQGATCLGDRRDDSRQARCWYRPPVLPAKARTPSPRFGRSWSRTCLAAHTRSVCSRCPRSFPPFAPQQRRSDTRRWSSSSTGSPENPNSYFVDRAHARFPQMDVWPSCCFGRYARSHAVRQLVRPTPASKPHSSKRQEDLRLLLTFTHHGCPRVLSAACSCFCSTLFAGGTWYRVGFFPHINWPSLMKNTPAPPYNPAFVSAITAHSTPYRAVEAFGASMYHAVKFEGGQRKSKTLSTLELRLG